MDRREKTAEEIAQVLPTFLRHMYPHVFEPMDVPPSQVIALVTIEEKGRCSLTELRHQMHVSAPTISGIIRRLEMSGYITRIEDPNDRRICLVKLTNSGSKIVHKFRGLIKKRWSYILHKMPREIGDTVLNMMTKITQGFLDGSM